MIPPPDPPNGPAAGRDAAAAPSGGFGRGRRTPPAPKPPRPPRRWLPGWLTTTLALVLMIVAVSALLGAIWVQKTYLQDLPALYQEKRGSVLILIVRGASAEIISRMRSYHPAVLDILPLTLEEIFIYEMGDRGYEIKNVLY